ncbi:MAG TPA: serine hydrolase [Phototrophicaceae bacterium]|nr:serine hydrolase [Phototrophicaceae bacterium]
MCRVNGFAGVILAVLITLTVTGSTLAQKTTSPVYFPTKGWQTSSPEAQGMNSTTLARVLQEIIQTGLNVKSVLVIRNGYLVMEAYRYPYDADMPHRINSATKSISSALVGIAIKGGYITSVSQKLVDFFPGRTIANLDDDKKRITLEDVLTMTSGLEWGGENDDREDSVAAISSGDLVKFVLDRRMATEPGEQFVYNSAGSNLLLAVVEQATGQDISEFANTMLFDPLGITSAKWRYLDKNGHPFGGTGITMTPRDMAKFGYLYLNKGQWDGQQVIPAAWVEASSQIQIRLRWIEGNYGYQWWVSRTGYYRALGGGGQEIVVVPDQIRSSFASKSCRGGRDSCWGGNPGKTKPETRSLTACCCYADLPPTADSEK